MQAKLKEKSEAQRLRKQGLSYNEILQKIPVAKSSVSLWCQEVKLTSEQKSRLTKKQEQHLIQLRGVGAKAVAAKRQEEIWKIKEAARKEIHPLTRYEFKIAGAMLFWAEGSKNRGVEITNSDPNLIKFMVCWLKKNCKVPPEKLKARLNVHANQNDKRIKRYWSRTTGIPLKQFGKSYIKPEGTGHRKNILHNGVISVRVGNEDLRHRIMTWIKLLHQSL